MGVIREALAQRVQPDVAAAVTKAVDVRDRSSDYRGVFTVYRKDRGLCFAQGCIVFSVLALFLDNGKGTKSRSFFVFSESFLKARIFSENASSEYWQTFSFWKK